MLIKSLGIKSDNVTYDLEDSVTPSAKPTARQALRAHLSNLPPSPSHGGTEARQRRRPFNIGELAIRINAVSTPYALDDLAALANLPELDAIVVPKVNSASDLSFVTDALRHLAPERHSHSATTSSDDQQQDQQKQQPLKIIALIESAAAILNLPQICSASPYLSGLIFAAEDFALDLSLTRTPSLSEFLYARSAIVTAARAYNLPSAIDLVCTSFRGPEGEARLQEECLGGKSLGFNGKQCIHPSQVEAVQRLFAPGEKEVEWAIRVVVADEKAARGGRGAWTLDGAMIDAPVTGKARAVVDKAARCGFDVEALREKWKDQEPE